MIRVWCARHSTRIASFSRRRPKLNPRKRPAREISTSRKQRQRIGPPTYRKDYSRRLPPYTGPAPRIGEGRCAMISRTIRSRPRDADLCTLGCDALFVRLRAARDARRLKAVISEIFRSHGPIMGAAAVGEVWTRLKDASYRMRWVARLTSRLERVWQCPHDIAAATIGLHLTTCVEEMAELKRRHRTGAENVIAAKRRSDGSFESVMQPAGRRGRA